MFSFISLNWKGKPLTDYQTVVNLIAATTTTKGLKVSAELAPRGYKTRLRIKDKAMRDLSITYHERLPKWNYTISPADTCESRGSEQTIKDIPTKSSARLSSKEDR